MAKVLGTAKFEHSNKSFFISKRLVEKSIYHNHSFFEIELVLSGNGITVVNGKEHPLKKHSLLVLNPMDAHSIEKSSKEPIELWNISFIMSGNSEDDENLFICNEAKFIDLDDGEFLKLISLMEIINSEQKEKVKSDVADLCFKAVMLLIKRKLSLNINKNNDVILNAIRYIQLHFKEDINIEDIAKHIGFSPQHFSKLFHSKMGVNYKKYLTSVRISYAKKLFETTSLKAIDIAGDVGFNSYSGFLKAFKQTTGLTVKEYISDN